MAEKEISRPKNPGRAPHFKSPEVQSAIKDTPEPDHSPDIGLTPFQPNWRGHIQLLSIAGSPRQRSAIDLKLQQAYGNQYVQRLLTSHQLKAKLNDGEDELQMKLAGGHPAAVPGSLETRIKSAQGNGHPLVDVIRKPMEQAFNVDFSGVRVHTNPEANTLNRELSAKAFTTGQDVFFAENQYNPGSQNGRELLAHELTHVVQQSTGLANNIGRMTVRPAGDASEVEADAMAKNVAYGSFRSRLLSPGRALMRSSGQIQRWAEKEHEAMGNKGWQIMEQHVKAELSKKALSQPQLKGLKGKKAAYGTLTQFGGDYTQTVDELKNLKSTETPTGSSATTMYLYYNSPSFREKEKQKSANYKRMVSIAETNVDHFSPLAQVQYLKHHELALQKAAQAAQEAHKSGPSKGDDLLNDAIVTEGFAAHFLQDSYASGHQCPRALDVIPAGTPWYGKTLTSLGTMSYHDMLCKEAVPMLGPAAGNYHGDNSATPGEVEKLAFETANSLAEVLAVFWGIKVMRKPAPSNGPNMSAITGNPELFKLWTKMTSGYKNQAARVEKSGDKSDMKMPGTKTAYSQSEVLKYYQYINGQITKTEYLEYLKKKQGRKKQ